MSNFQLRLQSKPHESPGDLELSFQSAPEITLHVSPNSYSVSVHIVYSVIAYAAYLALTIRLQGAMIVLYLSVLGFV